MSLNGGRSFLGGGKLSPIRRGRNGCAIHSNHAAELRRCEEDDDAEAEEEEEEEAGVVVGWFGGVRSKLRGDDME